MTLRVEVRFDPRALCRGNDGLDLDTVARVYGEALRRAIEADLPGAAVSIEAAATGRVVATVTGGPEAANRAAERTVLDLAWVVRETTPLTG